MTRCEQTLRSRKEQQRVAGVEVQEMIRIGIVHDHPVTRSGLKEFLCSHDDLSVVAEAADGCGVVDLVRDR